MLTIGLYLALFELIALLADRLLRMLEPLLRGVWISLNSNKKGVKEYES
jgi:hypothetical protein